MKAIIPAAGLGTRFLPSTKCTPKEMLPVLDKPVIQYVVEEALEPEEVTTLSSSHPQQARAPELLPARYGSSRTCFVRAARPPMPTPSPRRAAFP